MVVTSDKLLLEKPHLYDLLLDLTPLLPAPGQIHAHAPAKLPRLMHVERTPAPKQLKLKGDMWTTRDFAVFRELDAQATRRAERTRRRLRRRSSRSTMRSEDHDSDFRPPGDETSRYGTLDLTHQRERNGSHRTGLLATLLAFVRYWLAGWWIFPQNWALSLPSSYVLPLGIRGDGGVRASMLLLPESDSEASDLDDEDQEDDNYTEETHAEPVEDLQVEYDEQESEDGSVEEDEAPPDPLLAACGANIASRAPRHRAPAAADIFVAESQSSNPSRSTRRSAEHIFATGEASASSAQTSLDPRLAQALRSIWSRWVCGLLNAIDGLVAERMDASNPADKNGVVLGPSDMACLGLSASSAFDAHLLQTLAEESANGPIVVDRGWAILRWWT